MQIIPKQITANPVTRDKNHAQISTPWLEKEITYLPERTVTVLLLPYLFIRKRKHTTTACSTAGFDGEYDGSIWTISIT
jgi:hypothetical protein